MKSILNQLKESAMNRLVLMSVLATLTTLTFANSAWAEQFDEVPGMKSLVKTSASCPGGVCADQATCDKFKRNINTVLAACNNLDMSPTPGVVPPLVKSCNDRVQAFGDCKSFGNGVVTLTQAVCEKQGKELKDGVCVKKVVILTQAVCEKQGKELKGGICVDKPIVVATTTCKPNEELAPDGITCRHLKRTDLTQADCDKKNMDLKGSICVPKAVALTQADCNKECKDLKDGICVPKPVASSCNLPGWLLPLLIVLILLQLAVIAYLVWERIEKQKAKAKAEAKAIAESKVKCPKCGILGIPGKHCQKDGEKLPDLPAKLAEAPAGKFVTHEDLKGILLSFLGNQVETRVLQEKSTAFTVMLSTDQQILTSLNEATPRDEVEIKRVEARIGNLDFLKREAESISEKLISTLKVKDDKKSSQ